MTVEPDLILKAISAILTAVAMWAAQRRGPKLVSFLVHASAHPLPDGSRVHTHAIVVRNRGNAPATNVKILHRVLPTSIELFPAMPYETKSYDNGAEIILERLVPNEQVTISYLYAPPITWDQTNSM